MVASNKQPERPPKEVIDKMNQIIDPDESTKRLIEQTFEPHILEFAQRLFKRYEHIAKVTNDKNPMDFIDHLNATVLLGNNVMINMITKRENELGL